LKKTGSGATGTANSGMIRRRCVCGRTGTKCRRSKVSPSEGNEARREGCQEVAVPHSSVEAGERPSGPRGAKGVPRCGRGVGTTPRTPCLISVSPRNDRVVRGTAICHNVTNRMRLTRTSGSVGAPGSNPWGDPAKVNLYRFCGLENAPRDFCRTNPK